MHRFFAKALIASTIVLILNNPAMTQQAMAQTPSPEFGKPAISSSLARSYRDPHYWSVGFEYGYHATNLHDYSVHIHIRDDYYNKYGFYYDINLGTLILGETAGLISELAAGGHYVYPIGKHIRLRPIVGFASALYYGKFPALISNPPEGDIKGLVSGKFSASLGGGIDVYFPNKKTILESMLAFEVGVWGVSGEISGADSVETYTSENIYLGGQLQFLLRHEIRKDVYIQFSYDLDLQNAFWSVSTHGIGVSLAFYR